MGDLPQGKVEHPKGTSDSEQEISRACDEFFGFHPCPLFQQIFKGCREHGCKKEAEHRADAAWKAILGFLNEPLMRYALGLLGVFGFCVGIGYLLFLWRYSSADSDNSNAVIAFFTVVMAVTTWLSWHAMNAQNKIMIEQNKAIKAQLRQAKSASKQTEEMIGHMRREQRPWLGLDSIHWDTSDYRSNALVIVAKNTGRSPAQKISLDIALAWAEHGTFDSEAHASDATHFQRMFDGIVIPPEGIRSATLNNPFDYIRPVWQADIPGELYVILRYRYTDLAGTQYGTDHCCYWDVTLGLFPVYGPLAKMY